MREAGLSDASLPPDLQTWLPRERRPALRTGLETRLANTRKPQALYLTMRVPHPLPLQMEPRVENGLGERTNPPKWCLTL